MAILADSSSNSAERSGEYIDRVNRAIDHITRNLAGDLTLDEVAGVAGFSPYHFHRIFRGMVGETLHDFVQRVRLERALTLISRKERRTLTEVALECGFGSSSEFSRNFKRRFGVAPRAFDAERWRREGRARLSGTVPGNGEGSEVHERIGQLPEDAVLDSGVSEARFPAMQVAEVEMAGTVELELRALIWLYTVWLPRSGYLPDHQPGFEAFEGEPFANGDQYFRLRIQLPVVPAGVLTGR